MNEHMHTRRCLGASMIAVIENWRDDTSITDHEFALHVQNNGILEEAQSYLNDGVMTCTCGARMFNQLWHEAHNLDQSDPEEVSEFTDRVRRVLPYSIEPGVNWSPNYTSVKLFAHAYDVWAERSAIRSNTFTTDDRFN
jgi:hypothetical protein